MLTLKHVSKTFHPGTVNEKCALKNLSLELEDGDFALSNSLSNKTTSISNCSKGEIITIEGDSQIISSSLSAHKSLSKDFNYFFPKIINTYTETKNTFKCNLKCMITITYSPIRKVGL